MMEKYCLQLQNYQITADHLLDSKLSDLQARLDKNAGRLDLVNPLSILKKAMDGSRESTDKILASNFNLPRRFTKVMVQRFGNSPKSLSIILSS